MKATMRKEFHALLAGALWMALPAAQAVEVDFSCVSYKVWGKDHVSDQFMSYDVVIDNQCPGAVYWAMCIERLDQVSHAVVETHNPTGYVEKDKKARVNLHLNRQSGKDVFHNRFQEFYLDVGYAIDPPASARCNAVSCEQKKRGLRSQLTANEAAWSKTEKQVEKRVANDCPNTGWDKAAYQQCTEEVRATAAEQLDAYALKDRELRAQMAAIDPENCTIHSGELARK